LQVPPEPHKTREHNHSPRAARALGAYVKAFTDAFARHADRGSQRLIDASAAGSDAAAAVGGPTTPFHPAIAGLPRSVNFAQHNSTYAVSFMRHLAPLQKAIITQLTPDADARVQVEGYMPVPHEPECPELGSDAPPPRGPYVPTGGDRRCYNHGGPVRPLSPYSEERRLRVEQEKHRELLERDTVFDLLDVDVLVLDSKVFLAPGELREATVKSTRLHQDLHALVQVIVGAADQSGLPNLVDGSERYYGWWQQRTLRVTPLRAGVVQLFNSSTRYTIVLEKLTAVLLCSAPPEPDDLRYYHGGHTAEAFETQMAVLSMMGVTRPLTVPRTAIGNTCASFGPCYISYAQTFAGEDSAVAMCFRVVPVLSGVWPLSRSL
jgi:hypothetical protein